MAERQGEELLPGQREPWGEAFQIENPGSKALITPAGLQALEEALAIYAPYTTDELEDSPSLPIQKGAEAQQYLDQAAEGIITAIKYNYFDRKKVLEVDFIQLIGLIQLAIVQKYPEFARPGCRFSEGIIFGPLVERVQGYLMAQIALKEDRHREKTYDVTTRNEQGTVRKDRIPLHKGFFDIVAPPVQKGGAIFANLEAPLSPSQMSPQQLFERRLRDQYRTIKAWISFMRGKMGRIQNPEKKRSAELKAENDKIAALLRERANRDFPSGVTIEDLTSLCGEENPLLLHVTGLNDPRLPQFHQSGVMTSYLDSKEGEAVIADPEATTKATPKRTLDAKDVELFVFSSFGARPSILLRRQDGELASPLFEKETLKLIADRVGTPAAYELLRNDLLWNLSQLVCGRAALHEMWGGETFAPREKAAPRPKSPDAKAPTEGDPAEAPSEEGEGEAGMEGGDPKDKGFVVVRRYPKAEALSDASDALADAAYRFLERGEAIDVSVEEDQGGEVISPGDVEEAVEDAVEQVQAEAAREHTVSGYRKLLELIRRKKTLPDGSIQIQIIPARPSKQAVAAAKMELRKGLEIPSAGLLIKPKDVAAALKKFEVSTLEELAEKYPGRAYIRYETWVPSYTRGNPGQGTIKSVRGKTRTRATGEAKVTDHE